MFHQALRQNIKNISYFVKLHRCEIAIGEMAVGEMAVDEIAVGEIALGKSRI
jgi:hypothetical protein